MSLSQTPQSNSVAGVCSFANGAKGAALSLSLELEVTVRQKVKRACACACACACVCSVYLGYMRI
jgi:hypothetical protein